MSFGCSNTFGQGLPDCGEAPKYCGDIPSSLAWPSRFAEKLKRRCLNLAQPGSSNRQILWRILNFENYLDSDIVAILWTYNTRGSIIKGKEQHEIVQFHMKEWDGQPTENKFWRSFKVKTFDEYDNILENLHYIDYADRFLKPLVKHVMHYVTEDILLEVSEPYTSVEFIDNGRRFMHQYPKSLDGAHPGEQGHQAFADKMFYDLQDLRKRKTK